MSASKQPITVGEGTSVLCIFISLAGKAEFTAGEMSAPQYPWMRWRWNECRQCVAPRAVYFSSRPQLPDRHSNDYSLHAVLPQSRARSRRIKSSPLNLFDLIPRFSSRSSRAKQPSRPDLVRKAQAAPRHFRLNLLVRLWANRKSLTRRLPDTFVWGLDRGRFRGNKACRTLVRT